MSSSGAIGYPDPGEVIDGKYRIERILGEGGMGAVMAAQHLILRAPVALKFISPDVLRVPGAVERFINEGVAARGIQSDHIVRIDDVGKLPSGLPFIVMEMLSGCDLSNLIEDEKGGLPVARSVHFVLQILRGLHVAHGRGIVHRDLKPSNAFVITREGEPDFIKLLDFGISKLGQDQQKEAQQLTQTNTGLGTPLYMSPEQARNARDATARSDLYSVSAILYELLTGRTPYQAESPNDLLYKLFTTDPDPILSVRPDLPEGLAQLIHQGLSKDPAQRPGSALEYAELLAPYADARSAEVLARLRAAAGGVPASSLLAERSSLPGGASALDRTALADARTTGGQVAVSRTTASPQATHLEMTDAAPRPAPVTLSLSAKIALSVGVLAIVSGSAVLINRSAGANPQTATAEPPTATTSTAEPTPPPSSSLPQVVPVPSSAVVPPPAISSATSAPSAPSAKTGPAKPPPPSKKNPFGAGIVQ